MVGMLVINCSRTWPAHFALIILNQSLPFLDLLLNMQSVRIILNHVYHVWWGNTKISDQTGKVALVTGAK